MAADPIQLRDADFVRSIERGLAVSEISFDLHGLTTWRLDG